MPQSSKQGYRCPHNQSFQLYLLPSHRVWQLQDTLELLIRHASLTSVLLFVWFHLPGIYSLAQCMHPSLPYIPTLFHYSFKTWVWHQFLQDFSPNFTLPSPVPWILAITPSTLPQSLCLPHCSLSYPSLQGYAFPIPPQAPVSSLCFTQNQHSWAGNLSG